MLRVCVCVCVCVVVVCSFYIFSFPLSYLPITPSSPITLSSITVPAISTPPSFFFSPISMSLRTYITKTSPTPNSAEGCVLPIPRKPPVGGTYEEDGAVESPLDLLFLRFCPFCHTVDVRVNSRRSGQEVIPVFTLDVRGVVDDGVPIAIVK